MVTRFILSAVLSSSLLAGCTYYTRPVDIGPVDANYGFAVMTDIKQRAIISGRPSKDSYIVTCAEPSPDAMSSLSSSVSAALKAKPEQTLQFAQSLSESAAFTGMRTQTIQLLRDGMYRLCEGYMAGAISQFQYQWMMRRYQKSMVAILAIESLTGTLQVQPVTLTGTSSSSVGRSIQELEQQLSGVKTKLSTLQTEKDGLNEKDTDKKKELTAEIDRYTATKESLESAIANGQKMLASSQTSSTPQIIQSPGQASVVTNQATLDLIQNIINKIYNANDADGLCFEAIKADPKNASTIANICFEEKGDTSSSDGDSTQHSGNQPAGADENKEPQAGQTAEANPRTGTRIGGGAIIDIQSLNQTQVVEFLKLACQPGSGLTPEKRKAMCEGG